MGRSAVDITNQTFGTWEAIKPLPRRRRGAVVWEFRCSACARTKNVCGSQMASDQRRGATRSCKCQKKTRDTTRADSIFAAFVAGGTYEQVAQKFGITKQRVEQIVLARINTDQFDVLIRTASREALVDALLTQIRHKERVRISAFLRTKVKS